MRRRGALRALLMVPAFTLSPARAVQVAPAPYTFALNREGEGFAIAAQGDVDAARATVWRTVTDYEALQRFIPGMRESRVIERRGANLVVVRQRGAARFGPFREAFDVTFAVDEQEADCIDAVAIAGDFIEFRSHYELRRLDAQRTRLSYRARLRPRREPPPLFGAVVMESVARGQFEALLLEIERRAR
jgi:ribosome-associated toxin RatA of RatAB toxin-antitoxin module